MNRNTHLTLCLALVLSGGCSGNAMHPNHSGRDASPADYPPGSGLPATAQDSVRTNAIDSFLQAAAADHLWMNGADAIRPWSAKTPEEVVSETFRTVRFPGGGVTNYRIIEIRKIHINLIPDYTVALVDTDLGQMIFLMQYVGPEGSSPGHWWRRVYDATSPIKRLY